MAESNDQANSPSDVNLGGRPEKEINLAELRRVCSLHPTNAQLAAAFEVSERTIDRRIAEDPEFRAIVEWGRGKSQLSQRQALHAAVQRTITGGMERGDASLVLRLIAQPEERGGIGFTDKQEHNHRLQHSWADLVADEAGGDVGAGAAGRDPGGDSEGLPGGADEEA